MRIESRMANMIGARWGVPQCDGRCGRGEVTLSVSVRIVAHQRGIERQQGQCTRACTKSLI